MSRPNIFNYAQKELSQDAMICWLLECYHSEDKIYKQIGLDFIKFILEDETLTFENVDLEKESPHRQYYHIDVYANIRIGDKIIPVIFEDKTNTYLHGEQHTRYIDVIEDWKTNEKWNEWKDGLFNVSGLEWEQTRFIFFKTGYIFNWQREELKQISKSLTNDNVVFKTIELKQIAQFIQGQKNNDELLSDYYTYLAEKLSKAHNCTEAMFDRIFSNIFDNSKKFNYSYQGWAAADFLVVPDRSGKGENNIYYALRIDKRKNNDTSDYAIIMQQCRNEKRTTGTKSEKERLISERRENAVYARTICKEIFDELNINSIVIEKNDTDAMPEQNNIFKIFIDDEEKVCKFYKEFIKRFEIKMSKI